MSTVWCPTNPIVPSLGLASVTYELDTIAALRNFSSVLWQKVMLFGYNKVGDSRPRLYVADLTDTTSADNGGTVIVSADNTRWKMAFTDYVDIMEFGADPSATTDSTNAWLKARDLGVLIRANGRFLISGLPVITDGLSILGVNQKATQLILKNGANANIISGQNVNDIYIGNLYLNGNKANQSIGAANPWRAIYFQGTCSRIRIDGVWVDQIQDHGISLNDTNSPPQSGQDSLIINTTATNCGSSAHSAAGGPGGTGIGGGAESCAIIACLSQYNFLNGFKSPSGAYTNCWALDNGGGFETGFDSPISYGTKLTSCRSLRNQGSAYRHQGQGNRVTQVDCSALNNKYSGVDLLGGVTGVTISGGYYYNNGQGGSRVVDTAGIDGVTIHGTGSQAPSRVTICGGAQFGDDQATPTQQYAFYVTGSPNAIVVDDSVIVGTHAIGSHYVDPTAAGKDINFGRFDGNQNIYRRQSTVTSSGTATQTLDTKTLPAQGFVNGTSMRMRGCGRVSGTAGTKLIRVVVAGVSTIISNQASTDQLNWGFDAVLMMGSNASRILQFLSPQGIPPATISYSVTTPLTITVNTTPAGGDAVSLDAFSIFPEN